MPRTGRGPECDQEDRKITSPSNETHYGRTRVAREAGGEQCVSNRLYTYTRRLRVAASTECVEMARPVGPGRARCCSSSCRAEEALDGASEEEETTTIKAGTPTWCARSVLAMGEVQHGRARRPGRLGG